MPRSLRFVLLFILLVSASSCFAQDKKRVAVMNFDYATVRTNVAAVFGTDQDVGKGIADLLVTKLVQDGKYSVIERSQLNKILAEQNLSNGDRSDPSSAAKLGRILGVDAIIVGSITKFGRDDKTTGGAGGGRKGWTGALAGIGSKQSKAVVGVSARLVNVNTAEIMAAVTGNGESARSGLIVAGAGGSPGGAGGGAFDMSSSNFAQTIIGEAVGKAVDDTAAQLETADSKIPVVKVSVNAVVADVSGGTIIINVGSKGGVRVGDKMEISRAVRTVKDPSTGKVIKTVTDKIGDGVVTEVDESTATLTFNGPNPPKVGDIAKSI
jgi:curli biogenesis system outer membrane secretion channel CsgG